ncbi:hypothetical protein Hanom_Chr10g00893121 [Helianthus anomalus]
MDEEFYNEFLQRFVWDRQWVVINSKGRGYTQRVEPKLALVQVELPVEAFSFGWEPNNSSYLGIFFFHPHICVSVDKKKKNEKTTHNCIKITESIEKPIVP